MHKDIYFSVVRAAERKKNPEREKMNAIKWGDDWINCREMEFSVLELFRKNLLAHHQMTQKGFCGVESRKARIRKVSVMQRHLYKTSNDKTFRFFDTHTHRIV